MDHFLGFTNIDFTFNANISVRIPESGFLLQLGQTGSSFYPNISFSGFSGYIFDQRGDMVGGFMKNEAFNISGNYNYFGADQISGSGRLSYYINNTLISNNIYATGFIDCIRFEGYTSETIGNIAITKGTGESVALADSGATYILGSEGDFLIAEY